MANRLSQETSPYLLQHKNNPVDWYPWGPEALQRAQAENKPILLSVGYSACHWCHVMAHESFENDQIAGVMNANFINIKVDREERPDLDQIYQNVAQALTRSGGWPLTVFLTPDLKPYFGGTYFPPEDRYGRPGFERVLVALAEAFHNDREGVIGNAQKLTEFIGRYESLPIDRKELPTWEVFSSVAEELLNGVDWENGGWGGAPKFPNSMGLTLLWRLSRGMGESQPDSALKSQKDRMKDAVVLSLTKMAKGGIYDQLGGGFHRYSVDASWSVPHFEKMLYDNALLLRLYSEVLLTDSGQLTLEERDLYSHVVRQTVDYVLREMSAPEGGFYSAQDADTEGEEGKYFVWDLEELREALTPDESRAVSLGYGVTETGNFEHGKTVLFQSLGVPEVAKQLGVSVQQVQTWLTSASDKLLAVRSKRTVPGLDDKILCSWNGLMISGLAWAAQLLRVQGDPLRAAKAEEVAVKAFERIKGLVRTGDRLPSTLQGGKPKGNGFLDDYAFLAKGALDLSRFASDSSTASSALDWAGRWIQALLQHFKDPAAAGYFFTSDDHEKLLHRPKTIMDQAIPSGTAVATECMIALSELGWQGSEAEENLASLFPLAQKSPHGLGEILNAAWLFLTGPQVVKGKFTPEILAGIFRRPEVFRNDGDEEGAFLLCHRQTCSLPMGIEGLRHNLRLEKSP